MKPRKTTKRALVLSVCSIMLCLAMLIGTTFAWFMDTASTAVSTITSGTLGIEIQDANGDPVTTLDWQKAAEGKEQDILWEPGCTYTLTPFKLVNTGSLALKYKLVVTGLDGDSTLLDVIHFTYTINGEALDLNEEGHLAAKAETKMITISATMDTTAGNEYQGKTLEGVKFNVYATQDANSISVDTSKRGDFAAFADANAVSDWAKAALSWTVAEGIIGGSKESGQLLLNPAGNATRAQVAAILMRFIENVTK